MNRARPARRLVDASADFVAGERDDDSFDLAPVAEANDVAGVAAELGARGGLEPGVVAEAFDKLGGVGQSRPSGNVQRGHG